MIKDILQFCSYIQIQPRTSEFTLISICNIHLSSLLSQWIITSYAWCQISVKPEGNESENDLGNSGEVWKPQRKMLETTLLPPDNHAECFSVFSASQAAQMPFHSLWL